MTDTDYYTLQKDVQKLRQQLMNLKHQRAISPLQEKLQKLQNIQGYFAKSVEQITDCISDFNQNQKEIERTIQNTNYINISRQNAVYLKSINSHAVNILTTTIDKHDGAFEIPKKSIPDVDSRFLDAIGNNLTDYKDFYKCVNAMIKSVNADEQLQDSNTSSNSTSSKAQSSEIKDNFLSSDDTIKTIVTENVIASSPILKW